MRLNQPIHNWKQGAGAAYMIFGPACLILAIALHELGIIGLGLIMLCFGWILWIAGRRETAAADTTDHNAPRES